MKKVLLCLVVLFTTTLVFAQDIKLINKTVSDKNSRTLYIGIENELDIQGDSFEGIVPHPEVYLSHNSIKIRPTSVGSLTIIFLTKHGKNPILFNVSKLPNPRPVIGGQSMNAISKNSLPHDSELSLKAQHGNNTFFDNYKVVSFKAALNGNSYVVMGNKLSEPLISAIANSKNGDVLAISHVKGFNEEFNRGLELDGNFSFELK